MPPAAAPEQLTLDDGADPGRAPQVELRRGDMLDVLPTLPAESVHAVVTDPPYGLLFMGRAWDHAVPVDVVWTECLRVLKPGGHLLAFGGTRTSHRLACAIEDAGFELRDTIVWMHGQGFPKGKGQLKPAHEPIVAARKKAPGPWLNIDGCRVGTDVRVNPPAGNKPGGDALNMSAVGMLQDAQPREAAGRWPANVILTHAPDCAEQCEAGCPVAELDAQSGNVKSTGTPTRPAKATTYSNSGGYSGAVGLNVQGPLYSDSGGASRFFATFRHQASDRSCVPRSEESGPGRPSEHWPAMKYQAKAPSSERPRIDGKGWPTVKPLALMQWLVRLVTPPGGLILDPFAGTGTTLQAAQLEGFDSIGVERDPFAYALACQRLGLEVAG